MSETKLTTAQRRELHDMAGRNYGSHYDDNYKPIVALLRLGFVSRKDARYSASGVYSITDEGRAALSRTKEG